MDDFFGNLGKRITDTVEEIGKKAEDTLEIQRLKGQIHTLKRENDRDFINIGKMAYEKFKENEIVSMDFVPFCEEIEKREEEIEECGQKIERVKGE